MPTAKKRHEMAERRSPSMCGLFDIFRRRNGSRAHHRSSSASSVAATLAPARPSPRRVARSEDYTAIVIRPAKPTPVASKPLSVAGTAKPTPASKPVPGNGLSGELDGFLFDYQKTKGSSQLVRATSGNVMLYGSLGNLRPNRSSAVSTGTGPAAELCRAVSKREDPEGLKEAGNAEFRKGKFAEALALYDRAIILDPGNASYRSNKAAALAGLGRLLEAVVEYREAVRLDPHYCRAHCRLASLLFRLGEAERAIHHYKLSKNEAKPSDVSQAEALRFHFGRCNEARRLRDWKTVLSESRSAVSLGVDLSPQAFALQAEALMKLRRHSDAESVLRGAPKFDPDASAKVFGAAANGYVLMIQAQVDLASGRFDEAVATVQKAVRLDPTSREIGALARRARAVSSARSKGNDLFNSSKFQEACLAYSEGLDNDPHNAVLLCNRAACQAKLGRWEEAVDDCNAALGFRPSYAKARLRRADCNAKLKRWQASVEDYEILMKEAPGDKEVEKALMEAKYQLMKVKGDGA